MEGAVDLRWVPRPHAPEPDDLVELRRSVRDFVDATVELFMKAYLVEQKPVADVRAHLFMQTLIGSESRLMTGGLTEESLCDLFSVLMEREERFLRGVKKENDKEGIYQHFRTSWAAVNKIQKNRPPGDKLELRLLWMQRALEGALKAAAKDRENIRGIYYEEVEE